MPNTLLTDAKLALRVSTNAFDSEITDLIDAASIDLSVAGVVPGTVTASTTSVDPLVKKAVITYVKMNFGEPDQYERLKASYDEQKAQMSMATGYTTWTEVTL